MYWPKVDPKKQMELEKNIINLNHYKLKRPERNSIDMGSASVPKQRGSSINYERPWRNTAAMRGEKTEEPSMEHDKSIEIDETTARRQPKSSIRI